MARVHVEEFYRAAPELAILSRCTPEMLEDKATPWRLLRLKDTALSIAAVPGMETCREAADNLAKVAQEAVDQFSKGGDPARGFLAPMSLEAGWISRATTRFESALVERLGQLPFYVPDVGSIIKDERLVGSAADGFAPDVRPLLLPAAVTDINCAGRALAFDLGTACGFHLARALETTVEHFALTTKESAAQVASLAANEKNLGKVCAKLAETLVGRPFPWNQEKLTGREAAAGIAVANLFLLKGLFRNPLTHARDFTMTQDEAARFFHLVQQCMEELIRETQARAWSTAP